MKTKSELYREALKREHKNDFWGTKIRDLVHAKIREHEKTYPKWCELYDKVRNECLLIIPNDHRVEILTFEICKQIRPLFEKQERKKEA